MICYRDRTWCPFYRRCREGKKCWRALTPEVIKKAKEWWGKGSETMPNPPIAMYRNKPPCFKLRRRRRRGRKSK